jgi:hypothetical protein
MYLVDEQDEVLELSDVPPPDLGAPLPCVCSDEHRLLLAYIVSEPDPDWDGSYVTVISPQSAGMAIALITFRWPYAHMFGPPNDEAFQGHPLAERGLGPYAVFEVRHSSWVRQLERMNAVHPYHNAARFFATKRHYIFAFHDSTFECIAEGFEVQTLRGSMQIAMARMVALLAGEQA